MQYYVWVSSTHVSIGRAAPGRTMEIRLTTNMGLTQSHPSTCQDGR